MAQFASNTGTWMQTVGSQWLMGDLGGGAVAVALVQTATALPVFMLVLPAGALGDVLDRRRLLLAAQALMLAASALLAVLALGEAITPGLLLALTFAAGVGAALALPSFQAIQPELVERVEIPQAAVLNGVNFNLARAVGPALGGALIAASGPALVFALNAASFLVVTAVLAAWRRPPTERALGAEHVLAALGAGARFVRSAPLFRVVLVRAALFMLFASALWALLPVVARGPLGLDSAGYGLLLGSVGVGAVGGAFLLPVLRSRLDADTLVGSATVLYALSMVVAGAVRSLPLVVAALVVAGLCWIAVLSSLNASAQTLLPAWTRARGLAFYTLTFMGGQAIGSVVWGGLASAAGLAAAHTVAGLGLVGGAAFGRVRARLGAADPDVSPSPHWPEPHLVLDPAREDGPVLVSIEYRVPSANAGAFRDAMRPVGRSRRRTGAEQWGLFRDGEADELWVETFLVATWEEHLRQHRERQTVRDAELEAHALALTRDGAAPRVRHLLFAYPEHDERAVRPPGTAPPGAAPPGGR